LCIVHEVRRCLEGGHTPGVEVPHSSNYTEKLDVIHRLKLAMHQFSNGLSSDGTHFFSDLSYMKDSPWSNTAFINPRCFSQLCLLDMVSQLVSTDKR
jgi:hypothetical protein